MKTLNQTLPLQLFIGLNTATIFRIEHCHYFVNKALTLFPKLNFVLPLCLEPNMEVSILRKHLHGKED